MRESQDTVQQPPLSATSSVGTTTIRQQHGSAAAPPPLAVSMTRLPAPPGEEDTTTAFLDNNGCLAPGPIGIKRCDLWTYGGRCEKYTPVVNCQVEPVVILGHGSERFDDDDLQSRLHHNVHVYYRWKRGPARAVCFFHPNVVAKMQCTVTLRCFCSYSCFHRGQVQLRRFYLSGGRVVVPRQTNEYSYGVPCQKPSADDCREADPLHRELLVSAGLVVAPEEEVWSVISYNRHYGPTIHDVGHQLRFEVVVAHTSPAVSPTAQPNGTSHISPPARVASPLIQTNSRGGFGVAPRNGLKQGPPAPPGGSLTEVSPDVVRFWEEVDSLGSHESDQRRIVETGCVIPQAQLIPRRPMVPVGMLSLLGGSRPDLQNQRIIHPGTPLAEALGIGLESFQNRLPSRPRRMGGDTAALEGQRKIIREKRIALLTEQGFIGWERTLEQSQHNGSSRGNRPPPNPMTNQMATMKHQPSLSLATAGDVGNGNGFSVMTWNVLADMYATTEVYPYSAPFVLAWNYRRDRILAEILGYNPDIVCLQEVQGDHFEDFFAPNLLRRGYEGLYKQKTSRVFRGTGKHRGGRYLCDGCATFFKVPKFQLIDHFGIEFARVTPPPGSGNSSNQNTDKRLNKDNVALVLSLEQNIDRLKQGSADSSEIKVRRRIVVANTHILANPEAPDVKIWQANTLTTVLTEYLDKSRAFAHPNDTGSMPGLVVCGDFNSMPSSAVYELISKGSCNASHHELHTSEVCKWLTNIPLGHGLNLRSSYGLAAFSRHEAARGATIPKYDEHTDLSLYEPEFTNYTDCYVGCLDYIFFDDRGLKVTATLDLVREIQLLEESHALQLSDWALPSPQRPSDHFPLVSRFEWTRI